MVLKGKVGKVTYISFSTGKPVVNNDEIPHAFQNLRNVKNLNIGYAKIMRANIFLLHNIRSVKIILKLIPNNKLNLKQKIYIFLPLKIK